MSIEWEQQVDTVYCRIYALMPLISTLYVSELTVTIVVCFWQL